MRHFLYAFIACILLVILLSAILAVVYWQSRPADDRPAGNHTGNSTAAMAGKNATVSARPTGDHTGNAVIVAGGNASAYGQPPGNFTELFGNDTVIVVGGNADEKELEAARQIRDGLGNLTGNAPDIKTDANLSGPGESDYNLILVGMPGTNRLVNEIYRINDKDIRAGYINEGRNGTHNASYGSLLLFENPRCISRDPPRHVLVVDGWNDDGVRSAALVLSNESVARFIETGIFIRWNGTSYAWYSMNEVVDTTVRSIAMAYWDMKYPLGAPESGCKVINITSRNSDWAVTIGSFDRSELYANGTFMERLVGTNTVIVTRNGDASEAA